MQAVTSVALRAMVLGWLMCSPAFSQSFARVAVVDAWFNSQQRTNSAGQPEYFHYKWNDVSNSGFFLFGQVFRGFGVATDTLYSAPTVTNLKGAQFYIIVSPDIPVKNPHPHYLQPEDARQVAAMGEDGRRAGSYGERSSQRGDRTPGSAGRRSSASTSTRCSATTWLEIAMTWAESRLQAVGRCFSIRTRSS